MMYHFRRKTKILYFNYSNFINISAIALIIAALYVFYATFYAIPNPNSGIVNPANELTPVHEKQQELPKKGEEKESERIERTTSGEAVAQNEENVDGLMERRGLEANGTMFKLNSKPFRIMSGSIHYFRVPKAYWPQRIKMLKYAGLNTLETYVAWNMHQPYPDKWDFSDNLDIVKFIKLAAAEKLKVIIRPGPYICSEWDFGGLPAWLLSDPEMNVRSTYKRFMAAVKAYLRKLFALVAPLQYTKGGPIIAFQLENEYGSFGSDRKYMAELKSLFLEFGITELLFTSDGEKLSFVQRGGLPGVLATFNFQENPDHNLDILASFQPNRPLMGTELWTGWFDHWGEPEHHVYPLEKYAYLLERTLIRNASFNLYMFHGGTNFGFMNGANYKWEEENPASATYHPTVTSYDYDAPLTEFGGVTDKLMMTRKLIKKYASEFTRFGGKPKNRQQSGANKNLELNWGSYLPLTDALAACKPMGTIGQPIFVEEVCEEIQGYCYAPLHGFIAYRTTVKESTSKEHVLSIKGELYDRMQILVDGKLIKVDQENNTAIFVQNFNQPINLEIKFNSFGNEKCCQDLILLVENMGRVNYGRIPDHFNKQRKGFKGQVSFNGELIKEWLVYDLSLDSKFINKNLKTALNWRPFNSAEQFNQPAFYEFLFFYEQIVPRYDVFVEHEGWTKGAMFINGFNLGRFWNIGPQKSLYLPGPYLYKKTENTLILFELHQPGTKVIFKSPETMFQKRFSPNFLTTH